MTDQQFFSKLKIRLSDQQKSAIEKVDGPTLLLAVPGSGKTTALVARLGYMIFCKNINPEDILVLTYTVAAAGDMKKRFQSYFGTDAASPEFRTINGICAVIINYYGKLIGKAPFSLITDEKRSGKIFSDIYHKLAHEYATESEIKAIRTAVTYIKNMMLSSDETMAIDEELDLPISEIYKEYSKELKSHRLMDYDDQLVYAYNFLSKDSSILSHFQNRFKYVLVDEAQDTSKIQHKIIALLAADNENLFMVGDEDQSIYSFRAAYPDALLDFENDHKNASVLLLETNYRSNANIVKAADSFIKKNTLRHKKDMISVRPAGSEIKVINAKSAYTQYSYLAKVAKNCRIETAVLYRNNESAIPLVDILERERIPFRIKSTDYTFFTHRTVIDIKDIISFAYDPYDTDLFMKIYFKLKLYLNKESAEYACKISRKKGVSILDAAEELPGSRGYTLSQIRAVRTHLERLTEESAGKALFRICEPCGYYEYLERSGISSGRVEIIKNLASRAKSPKDLLNRLIYIEDLLRNKENDPNCKFILSTIHSSKGLEYDTVYLIDVCDGILPETVPLGMKPVGPELAAFEEERRLFYVGITRAKNDLILFKLQDSDTTFIDELVGINNLPLPKEKPTQKVRSSLKVSDLLKEIDVGSAVFHETFGEGIVLSANEITITISFGRGTKTFATSVLAEKGLLRLD